MLTCIVWAVLTATDNLLSVKRNNLASFHNAALRYQNCMEPGDWRNV